MLCSLEEHASWLAQEAGTLLLGLFNQNLHIEYKSAGYRDPVSNADKAAEQLLISHIQNNFPKHGILSEETEDSLIMDCDFLWVLDPLDGTTNYVNHYPFFGVSLGILYQGIPVVGAIFVSTPLISGGQVVHARHGGGAFSGKDPTKVDRSGAYAARWVAKNLVASGIAQKLELQISYAIGVAKPISIAVETFGTGVIPSHEIANLVQKHFDLRPSAIIEQMDLRRPIFQPTATYGHFGREDLDVPWERLNMTKQLEQDIS